MHKKIFKKFYNLNDSEWIDLLFQSVDSQDIRSIIFPGFPDEKIQIGMIGSSGKNALYDPRYMYQEIRRIAAEQKLIFNKKTTLLDFACGYGRNVRFFMKDIYPGNLYGSDVRTDFIDICRNTFSCTENKGGVIFDINTPFPPLKYKKKKFDIIMAYSLFSHLSEKAHLAWLKEFSRILKPDGLLFLTIRQKEFLNSLQKMSVNDENISNYDRMLIEKLGTTSIQKFFDDGEYIFNPSGGGHQLTNDFFGDTVIPDKYIHTKWVEWFDIIEHYDDSSRLSQAFICLKPKK